MKWLKRIAAVLFALIAVFALLVFWLIRSEAGARFALERVKSALADKLSYAQAKGTLVSPLELSDVRYRDPVSGIDVRIQSVKVEYALSGLFSKTLHVIGADIEGVEVALTTVPVPPPATPPPSIETLLTPPLAIQLDRAHIGRVAIAQDGQPLFASDSLDTALNWTSAALTIRQLALRAPDGKIDATGSLDSYKDLRGKAQVAFDWRSGEKRVAGTADVANDGKTSHAKIALAQPTLASLDGTIAARDDALPWTLAAEIPSFNPAALTHDESLKSLALKLQGSGDRTHGNVSGSVDLNAHRVLLDPLQFALAGQTLTLDTLRLRSPEAAGTLTARGTVQLDAKPVAADLALDWQGVELPADLVGQTLATHGSVHAGGSAQKFSVRGDLTIGPPGRPADIALELSGTPQAIALQRLALKQPKGGLDAHGEIVLQPQLGWDLRAQANKFDPGAFAKEWPGAIDMDLSTKGKVEKAGPAGQLTLTKLGGALRQRPLAGNADLRFAAPLHVDGTLDLKSGNSSVALRGRGGSEHTDVSIDLAIASLGDWLPQSGGGLRGSIALQGEWPRLDARGKLDATKLVLDGTRVENSTIAFDVRDVSAPSGSANIAGKTLSTGGYVFDTFKVDARGNQAAHAASVNLQGPQLGIEVALNGSLTTGSAPPATKGKAAAATTNWNGNLTTLVLAPKSATAWSLKHPAALRYDNGDVELSELCLGAENSSVCASATQTGGALQAKFALAHLPLTMIARLASPDAPLKLDGEINGDGNVRRAADGALDGRAHVASASGSVAYPDSASQPLIAYRNFDVSAALTPQQSTVDLRGEFADGGRLDGHIALGSNTASGMPLAGNVSASLGNLGFLDLLTGELSATKGKLDAKFALSGTTGAPVAAGNLALTDFATEVPNAGLKLHDGRIVLSSPDGRGFALDGSIASGDGKLTFVGNAGVADDAPLAFKIGGENFLAADIPGAQVRISPDLNVTRTAGKFAITGNVTIPRADIDVSKLQASSGAVKTSPDIVVTDAERTTATSSAPVSADITVKLGAGEKLAMDLRQGQEVHLVGFGLNGYLGGQLAVQESPGRPTTGRGQIVVDGTYKAYGQDLKIEQGRLLFAGTPVENPGLDLRATRGFTDPEVTVGLQVRGTAQVPVLTVFSEPAMEQSDALSYLVAGKPLSQLKSGEGDAVGSAARALGTAGGDLLAKSIGTRMGLDDVGVADSSAVGGAALTVGKYLSPRLYLSYGVGLFTPGEVVTLRYRLTRLFNVEVQNGTLSSRAGINYKLEK